MTRRQPIRKPRYKDIRSFVLVLVGIALAHQMLLGGTNASAQRPGKSPAIGAAQSLIEVGNADSAHAIITKALATDSLNVDLLLALAEAQKARHESNARRATLEKIIRVQKRSVDARLAIAQDFFALNQLDSAAFFANDAMVTSSRRSAESFYWLGRIHQQAGRLDSASFFYHSAWVVLPGGDLY